MVRAVVMYGIAAQIAQPVYIPCGIVHLRIQAIADIAAFDLGITGIPPIPSADVCDQQNGAGELNVQIAPLVIEIVVVLLDHQFHPFLLGKLGVLFLQIAPPILVVRIAAPDNMFLNDVVSRACYKSQSFTGEGKVGFVSAS